MFSASREKMTFGRRPFSIGSFVEVLKPQPSSRLAIFPDYDHDSFRISSVSSMDHR